MYKTIENLRSRPESHRRRVALGVSFIATALIFSVWLSVFSNSNQAVVAKEEKIENDSPIAAFQKGVAQAAEALKGIFESSETVDLSKEYEKIRSQVESGQIKLIPQGTE